MKYLSVIVGLVLSVLAGLVVAHNANAGESYSADIVEFGVYKAGNLKQVEDEPSPTGTRNKVTGLQLVEQTERIPGKLNNRFGVKWKINGPVKDENIEYIRMVKFPRPMKKADGSTQEVYRSTKPAKVGQITYDGYGFDNEWEIIPGIWTFEIWVQGKKLAEKSLTVYAPTTE